MGANRLLLVACAASVVVALSVAVTFGRAASQQGTGTLVIHIVDRGGAPLPGACLDVPDLESARGALGWFGLCDNGPEDSDPRDGRIELVGARAIPYRLIEATPPSGYVLAGLLEVSVAPGETVEATLVHARAEGDGAFEEQVALLTERVQELEREVFNTRRQVSYWSESTIGLTQTALTVPAADPTTEVLPNSFTIGSDAAVLLCGIDPIGPESTRFAGVTNYVVRCYRPPAP